MKPPKQMADEWAESAWDESDLPQEDRSLPETIGLAKAASAMGFIAGYEAATKLVGDMTKKLDEAFIDGLRFDEGCGCCSMGYTDEQALKEWKEKL